MCPMKVHMLTPKPQGDGVRRWGFWEVTGYKGEALLSGTSVLIKGTLESSLTPLPGEDAGRRRLSMSQEAGPHQTLKWPTP